MIITIIIFGISNVCANEIFIGEYKGFINDIYQTTTSIKIKNGQLIGDYFYYEDGKKTFGKLIDSEISPSDRTVIFEWNDKWGKGKLRIKFNQNYNSFKGTWGKNDNWAGSGWDGKNESNEVSMLKTFFDKKAAEQAAQKKADQAKKAAEDAAAVAHKQDEEVAAHTAEDALKKADEVNDNFNLFFQTANPQIGVSQITVNDNGDLMVSGYGDGQFILWDINSKEMVRIFNFRHKGPVKNLCIDDSKKHVVSSDNVEIVVSNIFNGKIIFRYKLINIIKIDRMRTFINHNTMQYIREKLVLISPDCKKIAMTDVDVNEIIIFDIENEKITTNIKIKKKSFEPQIIFSPNSNLVALSYRYYVLDKDEYNKGVIIIDIKRNKIIRNLKSSLNSSRGYSDLVFVNNGRDLLAHTRMGGGGESRYDRWSLKTGKLIGSYTFKDQHHGVYFENGSMRLLNKDEIIHLTKYGPVIRSLDKLSNEKTLFNRDFYKMKNINPNEFTITSISNKDYIFMGLSKSSKSVKDNYNNIIYFEISKMGYISNSLKEIIFTNIASIKDRIYQKGDVLYANAEINLLRNDITQISSSTSDESEYMLNLTGDEILLEDESFSEIWSKEWEDAIYANTTSDGNHIISHSDNLVRLWTINPDKEILINVPKINSKIKSVDVSNDLKTIVIGTQNGGILVFNIKGEIIWNVKSSTSSVTHLTFSDTNKRIISYDEYGYLKLWNSKKGQLLLTIVIMNDFQWAVVAPNGQFDKSPDFRHLKWRKGNELIDLDQFFDDFYTPGLLSQVYQTGELDETRNLDDALKQVIPTIEIIEPKKTTSRGLQLAADESSGCKVVSSQTRGFKKKKKKKKTEEPGCGEDGTLRVVTKVTDQGGGFQDIVLYHNGKRLESVEGDIKSGPAQKGKTQLVTFRVPLAPGENYLRAEAKSLSRVRARPWQMMVDFEAPKPKGKPDLYLYVVGINKYSNPKFNLNYGRPDAEAVQKALGDNLKLGAFEKVHVSGIYDLEATKKNITAQFLKFAKQARPRDVFIFYYAGHGRTLKDENGNPMFYLVSSNVGALDQDKTVKKGGISGLELINYSKKIRAGKQMFLFDACESGSVAKAFARIQKDSGGHILYAAASNQLATEFDSLGHGIFTYTLLKTLEDNKKLNVSLLSGGMDFLLEELRPKFNLTNQTFGYYRTLEASNFAIKSM